MLQGSKLVPSNVTLDLQSKICYNDTIIQKNILSPFSFLP